jgi:hypothetical protein
MAWRWILPAKWEATTTSESGRHSRFGLRTLHGTPQTAGVWMVGGKFSLLSMPRRG